METVETRGLELAYRRAGNGPLLVLLHGAVSDSRIWGPQLDALADEFTVVAWDEPGAGHSSDLPGDFTLADYAHCLADLIGRTGLGPAHVAGLSWGGTVALELYRQHPTLMATLILADTYAGWKGSLSEEEVNGRVAGVQELLAGRGHDVEEAFPGLFAGELRSEFVELLDEIQSDVRPATMARQVSVMAEADLRDLLPCIEVPALLLWGELDARSPLGVLRQFERAIPDTTTVVIARAGHVTNLERPEEFNDAVRRFCRTSP